MKGYSEVFYYCIQEAIYWKLKAEIYSNSEQDKKCIQDPTKSSSCKIHSENDVTKYVYIPTDKKNINPDIFDLELTKVGLGARNGVDNVMLVVKEFEECKREDTFNMMSKLGFHGGKFKDRGMVMVTEESKLIDDDQAEDFPETESQYFRNVARSNDYSNILKTLTAENRVFSFDKKRVDEPKMRTEMGEFFKQEGEDKRYIDNFRKIQNSSKIVQRATEGSKYTSGLAQIGMNVYRNMYTASKGVDIQVDKRMIDQVVINHVRKARNDVNKLRIDETRYVKTEQNREIETKLEERKREYEIEMARRRLEEIERERRRREERDREREREERERQGNCEREIKNAERKLASIRSNGEGMLKDIKKWLESFEQKYDPKYLEVQEGYEELGNMPRDFIFGGNDQETLNSLRSSITELETWNMKARDLYRQTLHIVKSTVTSVATAATIGALAGSLAGPAGIVVGGVVGGVGGAVVGIARYFWWS